MKAIQLYDKYTEEIVGTVLLKNYVTVDEVCRAWDKYQQTNNTNTDNPPEINHFVSQGNWEICEVLEVDFYQTGKY